MYETGGEEALQELSRRKPNVKNRVPEHVEQAVVDIAIENPALGQLRAFQESLKKGIIVSPAGVRSIWVRHDLETLKKRLNALEAKVAQDGVILLRMWPGAAAIRWQDHSKFLNKRAEDFVLVTGDKWVEMNVRNIERVNQRFSFSVNRQ